ncbi:unnamed protein product [Alternaria burnsii]|nr:unnamed protein product [Alternaria burnsii]
MPDQKDLSDNERSKTTVQASDTPADRQPEYERDDPVKMMVTVSGNTHHKTFHVARSQFVGSRWMYELKDPVTNSSWEEGKLFPGNDLENDQ